MIERLKQRKRELQLTNQQVADLSGVSLGSVNKIFSGATKSPQYGTVAALARALNMDVEALLQDASTNKEGELPEAEAGAEWIAGQRYPRRRPSLPHQILLAELCGLFCSQFRCGECTVIAAPVSVQLDETGRTVVQPDIVVLSDSKKCRDGQIYGAPDLVIEIVSEESRSRDYFLKLSEYRISGVREYWIADWEKGKITVYRFDGEDFELEVYALTGQIPVGVIPGMQIDFGDTARWNYIINYSR